MNISSRVSGEEAAWISALCLFVLGDSLTTWGGMQVGAVEGNPATLAIISAVGLFPAMLVGKAAVFLVAGIGYKKLQHRSRIAIPVSLSALGFLIVVHNLIVISILLSG